MLYYAAAIGMLGALDSTPIRSMVSKMVEPTEFGKLFTFLSTAQGMKWHFYFCTAQHTFSRKTKFRISQGLTSLMTSSGFQAIYAKTIEIYPGAMYLVSAGLSAFAVVSDIL